MHKCLYCYRELKEGERDMHEECIRKFFGAGSIPTMEYTTDELDKLAQHIIQEQTSLTGVQPKLSLNLTTHEGCKRLTIVGLWGDYICKPQTSAYEMMPEVEDLTMHLAEAANIEVVPHTLMRMADNSICYLTKRIDRKPHGEKDSNGRHVPTHGKAHRIQIQKQLRTGWQNYPEIFVCSKNGCDKFL